MTSQFLYRRRQVITLLGGAAAWPIAARAQQAPLRPLIGVLSPVSAAAARPLVTAFRSALRDLGYLEGRNMSLALQYGDGAPERMPSLARELVTLQANVIVAGAQSGALAAYNATRMIPIVAIVPDDPVVAGLANSIARPGRNVTGTWAFGDDLLVSKRLDFLKLATPGLARVAVMMNPDDPTDAVQIPRLPAAARGLGLALHTIEVRNSGQLDSIAAEIGNANVQGLFVGPSPSLLVARTKITAMVAQLKLPAIYSWRQFAEADGLMSYGPNLPDMWRQSARLVDRILKGADPGDLSFELPTRYELIVNLKTAKSMGLKLPDAFVLLADEVIE
jgi:putative ABC transport system substrate-binding protein